MAARHTYRATDYTLCHRRPDSAGLKLAKGLGWFSLALGTLELLASRTLADSLGMFGCERLVRSYGLREIATGIGILASKDPTPWIWGRVVGDALDLGTLAGHTNEHNPEEAKLGMALANVTTVTAVDIYCALKLSRQQVARELEHDYSDRSGFPKPPPRASQQSPA